MQCTNQVSARVRSRVHTHSARDAFEVPLFRSIPMCLELLVWLSCHQQPRGTRALRISVDFYLCAFQIGEAVRFSDDGEPGGAHPLPRNVHLSRAHNEADQVSEFKSSL